MIRMAEREGEEEEEEKTSECSSGCQSGWTMYLDQSYEKLDSSPSHKATSIEEDDEEDLSMVSDASSGPPHFHEEEDHERYSCCRCRSGHVCSASSLLRSHAYADNAGKKRRVEEDPSLLNDTASSPFFGSSKTSCTTATTTTATNNKKKVAREELSCGFSATHFKARPAASVTRLHSGFLQSSTPAEPYSVCGEEGKKRPR